MILAGDCCCQALLAPSSKRMMLGALHRRSAATGGAHRCDGWCHCLAAAMRAVFLAAVQWTSLCCVLNALAVAALPSSSQVPGRTPQAGQVQTKAPAREGVLPPRLRGLLSKERDNVANAAAAGSLVLEPCRGGESAEGDPQSGGPGLPMERRALFAPVQRIGGENSDGAGDEEEGELLENGEYRVGKHVFESEAVRPSCGVRASPQALRPAPPPPLCGSEWRRDASANARTPPLARSGGGWCARTFSSRPRAPR